GEAVDLEVDEARGGDAAAAAAPDTQARHQAVIDRDVAQQELAVHQRGGNAEPHRAASRTLPAAARRSRAVAASTSRRSMTSATSRSSPAPARAVRACSSSQPAPRQQMRTARSRSLALATRI